MVRGKGTMKKVLSYSERQAIGDEKKELESVLREKQDYGHGTTASNIDEGALKRQVSRLDQVLAEGAVPRVSGSNKDRMASRSREIEEILKIGMPTRYEMDHPAKSPGAVRKHMSWDARNRANIEEYKQIQRTLNPDAPVNIEELRREK